MPPAPPSFVVVDTETTGLDAFHDRIIDLGAVRLGPDLQIVDRFQTLVDPGVPIPLHVSRMVGLTQDDLREAPSFAEAYRHFRRFTAGAVLVAHNAPFDREHLAAGARRAGLPELPDAWLDTLEAALCSTPSWTGTRSAARRGLRHRAAVARAFLTPRPPPSSWHGWRAARPGWRSVSGGCSKRYPGRRWASCWRALPRRTRHPRLSSPTNRERTPPSSPYCPCTATTGASNSAQRM
jgi:hypothetical protein